MQNDGGFAKLRKELEAADLQREAAIAASREVVRLSKRAIYAVHRGEMEAAEKLLGVMKKKAAALAKNATALAAPHLKIAEQEYTEAACLLAFAQGRKMPTAAELKVGAEHYLLGVCDLAGELGRYAVNAAIRGRRDGAEAARNLLDRMYGELLQFDFRNGELRKKFDGVKYELKKLEDLVLSLRTK